MILAEDDEKVKIYPVDQSIRYESDVNDVKNACRDGHCVSMM